MEPYIDFVKLEFMKFVKEHPNPEDVIPYLLKNMFDGPPAMVGMVQRAVRTLAEQLNASDAHFILELIQNFEDNEYGSALPTMFFHLDGDKLYVACNEIGMKATDVYALCNVGDSTKKTIKDDAHGYLGEKGIGFKSIFKVAHTVQVYSSYDSRDQMWKFDLTETPRKGIGYIVPGLLESVPSQVTSVLEHVCRDTRRLGGVGGTCLVLLLKPQKVELVAKQIKQLSPETIMFLRKIHKVKIQSGTELVSIKAEKSPFGLPSSFQSSSALHCKLHSKSKTKDQVQEYLIFQNVYDMKSAPCKEREGMEVRSISIAIPMLGQSNGFRGKIFAYLPTGQETLLPFHINADFLLTASRNDFLMDHKWNNLIFSHVVSHVGLAATYLSSMSQAITLVDVMQLVPTLQSPNSFSFLHRSILAVLAPLPIFPVYDHQSRVRADACVIAPSDLFALLKPGHSLPVSPMLLDIIKATGFQNHARVMGVRWADKSVLESVIQAMLPKSNETPDPAWFCALYLFMSSHDYWKAGRNHPVTQLPILLLSNGSLVSFETTVYHQSVKELYPLRKWWDDAPMLSNSALPKSNDELHLVRAWLESNRVHKLDIRSASRFITAKLMDASCSAEDILEATITILTYQMSSYFTGSTLPFISSNNEVVRPPFTKSILAPDNKFLRLYNGSDFDHFYMVNRRYLDPKHKQQLQSLFPIAYAPPLPNLFSWMRVQNPDSKSLSASLLLELLYESSVSPSEAILQFLNSNEWLPTTKGKTTPRKAFVPSPELLEIFSETVPFVHGDIYQNECAKNALLKYTKVNRTATTADVLELLRYNQDNRVKDLTSILPLLKYLLEKKAMPPIPFTKSLEGDWEWKSIDDFIWVKESIPEIPSKRTNMKESKLDLSLLRKLFPKSMKRYSNEECINAYKKFMPNSATQAEVVEKVLLMIYKRFPKDLSGVPNLRVWCGHFHQFQPPQEVLFNDQNSLAKRFAINQLKLLWFPKEIEAKSKKIEIASLLQVNSISSQMIDLVESKRLPYEPTVPYTPLFGRFVRSALCRWHFNKCKNDWDRGNPPERVQELLKTRIEESHVIELIVIKGVKVNGEVKKSSVKTAFKTYHDHYVDPPVLYHNIREGEEEVVDDFLDYLARVLKIGENSKDSFELTMRKAIIRQNSNTDFLKKFPNIPNICKDPSSSAYFSESDKARQLRTTKEPSMVVDEKSIETRISEIGKEMAQPNNSADKMNALIKRYQALTLEKAAQEAIKNGSIIVETTDPFQPSKIPVSKQVVIKQTKVPVTIVTTETTLSPTAKSAKGTLKRNHQNAFSVDDLREALPIIYSNSPPHARGSGQSQNKSTYSSENKAPFSSTRIIPVFSPQGVPFQKRSSAPRDANSFSQSLSPNFENVAQRDGSLPGVPRIVVDRPNQADVRAAAIERYGGCIITGTSITELVQAAHIKPWSTGEKDVDDDDNIILLRSDIHLMLDNDPAYLYFTPSPLPGGAQDDPNYSIYTDTEIRLPERTIELLLEYGPVPPE